jgi:hypothetical protein
LLKIRKGKDSAATYQYQTSTCTPTAEDVPSQELKWRDPQDKQGAAAPATSQLMPAAVS